MQGIYNTFSKKTDLTARPPTVTMADMMQTVKIGYDYDEERPAPINAYPQQHRRPALQPWVPQYEASDFRQPEPLIPNDPPYNNAWGAWKWLIVLQGLAIVGLAVGLILVATTHNDQHAVRDSGIRFVQAPVGGYLEPSKLPAPDDKTQRKSYSFTVTGVYARYPTEGGGIDKLDADRADDATCCCKYRIMGKSVREAHTCAKLSDGDNHLLNFKLQQDEGGSHLLLSAGKDLLDAQCTLTWL